MNSTKNKLKFKTKDEIEIPNWEVLILLIIATEQMNFFLILGFGIKNGHSDFMFIVCIIIFLRRRSSERANTRVC